MSKGKQVKGMLQSAIRYGVKSCVGYGGELTRGQQNVVYYIRGKYDDVKELSDEGSTLNQLGEQIKYFEDYVKNNTQWTLLAGYADIDNLTFRDYQMGDDGQTNLTSRRSLHNLLDDIRKNRIKVDMIVVNNISQISTDFEELNEILEVLFSKQVVIFCTDSQDTFTLDSRILDNVIARKSILIPEYTGESLYDFD